MPLIFMRQKVGYPSIRKFCADAGYQDAFVSDVKEQLGLDIDISEKIKPHYKARQKVLCKMRQASVNGTGAKQGEALFWHSPD